jgi:antitoxin YefM
MPTSVLSYSEARARLLEAIETSGREPVLITHHGRPAAVLISPEEFERLVLTLDLMSWPGAVEELAEEDRQLVEGRLETYDHEEVMAEYRRLHPQSA